MGIREEVGLLTGRFLARYLPTTRNQCTKSRSHFAAEYSIGGLPIEKSRRKLEVITYRFYRVDTLKSFLPKMLESFVSESE